MRLFFLLANVTVVSLIYGVMNYPLILPGMRYLLMGSGALFLALQAVFRLVGRDDSFPYMLNLKIAACFLGYLFIHYQFFPANSTYGENKIVYLYFLFILGFVIVPILINSERELVLLSQCLFIVAILFCLISIFGQSTTENVRRSELGLNPSFMGKICVIPAIYLGSQLLSAGTRIRIWHVLVLLISVMAILKTGSRAVLIMFFISMVAMAVYVPISKFIFRTSLLVAVGLGGFVAAIQLHLLPEQIVERFKLENLLPSAHSDEGDRLDLFGLAINLIVENPLGVGSGNFSSYHRFIVAPHNYLLESTTEFGWLMGLLVSSLFGWLFVSYRRISKNAGRGTQFFFLLYTNVILNAMVGGDMTHTSFLIYVSSGILVCVLQKDKQSTDRSVLRVRKHYPSVL